MLAPHHGNHLQFVETNLCTIFYGYGAFGFLSAALCFLTVLETPLQDSKQPYSCLEHGER